MRYALLLLALAATAACSSSPSTSSTSSAAVSSPPASSATPPLAPDGKHFAGETKFQGECAPAGSRGGCYSFTFKPGGEASHVLLDARDAGTYRIEGDAVVYRSAAPDSKDVRMVSTDGFRTLPGGYRFTR